MLNEDHIITECKKKSAKAQKALYEQYSAAMRGVCRRYAPNISDAEDILHEGFMLVFNNIEKFEAKGSLGSWIKRIMINSAISGLRKKKKLVFTDEYADENFADETDEADDYEPNINPNNIKATIENAGLSQAEIIEIMHQLPHGYRTVFNLYAVEGFKHREIAEMLGIDINTSKSQLARARRLMQSMLFEKAKEKARGFYQQKQFSAL